MSVDVDEVVGFDGPGPVGACSNGVLHLAIGWDPAAVERLRAFLVGHPDAQVKTDHGDQPTAWLLRYLEEAEPPPTDQEFRQALRGYGWPI